MTISLEECPLQLPKAFRKQSHYQQLKLGMDAPPTADSPLFAGIIAKQGFRPPGRSPPLRHQRQQGLFSCPQPCKRKEFHMPPKAGFVLQDQVVPRLKSAIPNVVHCVGAQDHAELVEDSIALTPHQPTSIVRDVLQRPPGMKSKGSNRVHPVCRPARTLSADPKMSANSHFCESGFDPRGQRPDKATPSGKRHRHTRCLACVPSALILHPTHRPLNLN
jgi:hypothetical protein